MLPEAVLAAVSLTRRRRFRHRLSRLATSRVSPFLLLFSCHCLPCDGRWRYNNWFVRSFVRGLVRPGRAFLV